MKNVLTFIAAMLLAVLGFAGDSHSAGRESKGSISTQKQTVNVPGSSINDQIMKALDEHDQSMTQKPRDVQVEWQLIIKNGDTLSGFSKRFGVSIATLQRVNGIKNPDLIIAGEYIRIPVGNPEKASVPPQAKKPTAKPVQKRKQVSVVKSVPEQAKITQTALEQKIAPNGQNLDAYLAIYPKQVAMQLKDLIVLDRFIDVVQTDDGIVSVFTLFSEGNEYTVYRMGDQWAQEGPTPIPSSKLRSEVFPSGAGPAHIFDGERRSTVTAFAAIETLFPKSPPFIREGLLEKMKRVEQEEILLNVGDTMERMVPAEGVLFERVLQAQLSNEALPAKCFAVVDDLTGKNYLLIRDFQSGNWYGEIVPNSEGGGCTRDRTN